MTEPLSLKWHLAQIGEPQSTAIRIPTDFYVVPPSGHLSDIMKAMRSPEPEQWTKPNEGEFSNKDWTSACQGVTHDSSHWYVSSNDKKRKRVYQLSLANKVIDHVSMLNVIPDLHLGAIAYHDGRIYCAMENPVHIVVIDTPPFNNRWWTAALVSESGGPPPQIKCSWCAVNPWNGLLYSSSNGWDEDAPAVETLRAYRFDRDGMRFVHTQADDIQLQVSVRKVQGGVFSKNGHVLLASDYSNDIRCYSTLNGHYLGHVPIAKSGGFPEYEEVEGLTIWEDVLYDGVATHVHVILLDNDSNGDDVYFKHYRVPLSDDL
ncbi:hypothetical protein [Nocardia abscessus]|uniref:hypothetical protein n=1 Tax=Nocardia abscessus TaxID=120957 RepID=UPI0024581881|nr:hypothetical protein [Nocardia abscessus]